MSFFGQIQLDDDIFPLRKSDFAYIFLGEEDGSYGNNSVVFQSPGQTFTDNVGFLPLEYEGPALTSFDNQLVEEFAIRNGVSVFDDPREYNHDEEEEFWAAYWKSMSETQIGGLPFFSLPMAQKALELLGDLDKWRLLFFAYCDCEFPLLLPSVAPIYFVFVNHECTEGKIIDFCMIA